MSDVFIEKLRKIHVDLYDYSLVNYETRNSKIKIKCKKHGIFEQVAARLLSGHCCPKCASGTYSKKTN